MLDAVTIEILWSRITSIVDEAAKVIIRTSFSTLSNEADDFACVLTDAMGQSLAQNTGNVQPLLEHLARFGGAVPFRTDADDPRRRDHRRLCRLVAAAAARHQLPADLYERDDRLSGEIRAAAEFAEQ